MAATCIKRLCFIVIIFSIIVSGTLLPSPHQATAQGYYQKATAQGYQKATWLWKTERIRTNPQEVLSFLRQNNVNLVYLQINIDIPVSYYKSFIKASSKLGIQVQALDGAPRWGLESERYRIDNFLSWVRAYQKEAAASEKFSGIHVDIEPHLLSQWKTDQSDVIRQWQSNVLYLNSEAEKLQLPLSADIPFWLSNYTAADGKTPLSRFMISQYDSVTIMSYRDSAAAINSIAKKELEEATALGKQALAAVETKPSSEGDFLTFYEEGAAYMNEQLVQLHELAKVNPSYNGIAIHDFDGWKDLN
ncbi:hypothetical protein MUG84_05600 [Paenibacillus sp. KQZ6P-2]|uniref:Amidase n=1 Tax=Paenibacillus mangrovi TaxID=2931978 RepID=A0A9X2B1F4_9BACL|nr:hypothetical protein [Paenibacillus mangrovi]MCJ8011221.1 hypothetical protein [Paenibacillus mangrovi]